MRGYIQVYTGAGKGKTTAALGLALRAAGAGLRVFIAQFVKMALCSELTALKRFSGTITIRQFGKGFVSEKPSEADILAAETGLMEVKEIIASGDYQIVILDEANVATHLGLLSIDNLLSVVNAKPSDVELIITGRNADPRVIDAADLVTEMVEVKHYYRSGIAARIGIEK